jgi:hypothetical protein
VDVPAKGSERLRSYIWAVVLEMFSDDFYRPLKRGRLVAFEEDDSEHVSDDRRNGKWTFQPGFVRRKSMSKSDTRTLLHLPCCGRFHPGLFPGENNT